MKIKYLVGTVIVGIAIFVGVDKVGTSNTVNEDTGGNETEVLGVQAVEDGAERMNPKWLKMNSLNGLRK